MDIAEMLADATGHSKEKKPRPLHEAQIAELRTIFAAYRTCPFKWGDLVMPRPNSPIKWAGEPHIVLEVRPDAEPHFECADPDDTGSTAFGRRLDIRVAVLGADNESICAYWNESWNFIPYEAA